MERSEIRDAAIIEMVPDCATLHPGYELPSLRVATKQSIVAIS
jgi:hypothetical protein